MRRIKYRTGTANIGTGNSPEQKLELEGKNMVLAQENDELHKKTEQQTKQKNAIAELVVFSGTVRTRFCFPQL